MRISLFLVSLILFGCAQQKVTIKNEDFEPFVGMETMTKLKETTAPVKIVTVKDTRPAERGVGEARTGAQFQRTPVFLEEAPSIFVRKTLERELEARGMLIVNSDQEAELTILIKTLWVEEVLEKYQPEKAKCKIDFEITGKRANKSYSGRFWSEIVSPGDMGDATEKLSPTLASCMNSVVEKIAKDKKLAKFLKAKPLI